MGFCSKNWTAEGELPLNSVAGKTVLVTGGNSGIGFEAAHILAVRGGANVVICSRNLQRVNEAVEKIQLALGQEDASVVKKLGLAVSGGSIKGMQMDLASLDSVKSFAREFLEQHDRLDILIHNAGTMFFPEEENEKKLFKTVDGFERYTQINHLGSFLLTKLVWPLIVKTGNSNGAADPARVVLVASGAQWEAWANGVDFSEDAWKATPEGGKTAEKEYNVYGASKLMNVLFMRKLAQLIDEANSGSDERKEEQGTTPGTKKVNVLSTAMHPGGTLTNLVEHAPALLRRAVGVMAMTPQKGCLGEVRCAVDATVKNGSYYGPKYAMGGYPIDVSESVLHNVRKWAKSQEQMDLLWEKSEEAVLTAGEKFRMVV